MSTLTLSLVLLSASVAQLGTTAAPTPAQDPAQADMKKAQAALQRAYLKELAFLKAQKRSLTERLGEMESATGGKLEAANKELADLELQVLGLRRQGDRLQDELERSEIRAEKESVDGLVDSTLQRASEAIGKDLKGETTPDRLRAAFSGGVQQLDRLSSTVREDGSFFLVDGTKVDGDLIKVGAIAAYGVSDRGAGALAPAGDGAFRLWDAPTESTARALLAGEASGILPIFLFEGVEEAVTQKAEPTLVDQLQAGGFIAWVIVILGLAALVFALLRTLMLARFAQLNGKAEKAVLAACEQGSLRNTLQTVTEASGPSANVLHWALTQMASGAQREETTDRAIEEALLQEGSKAERFGTLIVVVAAVAPLLGLLGTVTGMITTFDVITEFGTGDPRMLSGGISEALITTKLGLMVAIPALLAATLLAHWAEGIVVRMEHAALHVVNVLQGSTGPAKSERVVPMPQETESRAQRLAPRAANF